MKVLGLSGSLRSASINSAFLRAVSRLAPAGIRITVSAELRQLPLFNPDDEAQPPQAVVRFHAEIAAADALIIASPEYAHGITGTMKNALDWLVGFEPFAFLPVAVINTSPRARHADAALKETLTTMAAVVVEEACIGIPLLGAALDEDGMVVSPEIVAAVQTALKHLHAAHRHRSGARVPVGGH